MRHNSLTEIVMEVGDVLGLDGKACCRRVTAKAKQTVAAIFDGDIKVKPMHGTARTLAAFTNDDGRQMIARDEFRGDQA